MSAFTTLDFVDPGRTLARRLALLVRELKRRRLQDESRKPRALGQERKLPNPFFALTKRRLPWQTVNLLQLRLADGKRLPMDI